ncbi:hypothetical protein V6S67_11635 [Arthrobacter sp. Soc17.1.1.1]|uniref:FMN-binding protein n=1 Tax=Arthrobacter sp. Soc17.1.1.1 TaxID=3121277 RepID=UPI002FE4AB07
MTVRLPDALPASTSASPSSPSASAPASPSSSARTNAPTTGRAASPLPRRVLTALAAVSILGAAGCAGAEAEPPAPESQAAAPAESPAGTGEAPATTEAGDAAGPAAADQVYEDGTYTETGSYQSPAGPEEVGVTMTLEADVVTAVEVEPMPDNPTTTMYQERFAGGITDAIVGRKLDDLTVDKVAGSSLTSGGFNEAADKIKSEAQL